MISHDILTSLILKDPGGETKISNLERNLSITLPKDYKNFLRKTDGAEGPMGENSYLALWSMDQIVELNESYMVTQFAPGIILFGSDGGDTAFGFDTRNRNFEIVSIPFVGLELSAAKRCAHTFKEFLKKISKDEIS